MKILYKIIRNHRRQGIPGVFIQVENEKYLFNVPETTQRFIKEHGLKFSKDMKFFFSNLSTNHLMGVVGLFLTLFQQQTATGTLVYGPRGICQFFKDVRYMMGIKLNFYAIASIEDQFEEEIPAVRESEYLAELIERKDAMQVFMNWEKSCRDGVLDEKKLLRSSVRLGEEAVREYFSTQDALDNGFSVYSDELVEICFIRLDKNASAYAFIPKNIEGNFDQEKLLKYGISGNKMRSLVKTGKVEVDQGGETVVMKIGQFRDKPAPGPAILMLDTPEGFDPVFLTQNRALEFIFKDKASNPNFAGGYYFLSEVIHFGDLQTVSRPEYQGWVGAAHPDEVFRRESPPRVPERKLRRHLFRHGLQARLRQPQRPVPRNQPIQVPGVRGLAAQVLPRQLPQARPPRPRPGPAAPRPQSHRRPQVHPGSSRLTSTSKARSSWSSLKRKETSLSRSPPKSTRVSRGLPVSKNSSRRSSRTSTASRPRRV